MHIGTLCACTGHYCSLQLAALTSAAPPPGLPACLCCSLPLQAHPFDTEEGRAALTSPFAAGAFQVGQNSGSRSSAAAAAAAGPAAAQERGRRGPHDSAGTTHSSSAVSGTSSHRSFLAAHCARIETKSIHLGQHQGAAAAAEAAGGEPAAAAAAAHAPPPEGALALEMQPMAAPAAAAASPAPPRLPGLSANEAEQRDLVGAMLSESQAPRRASDETVSQPACCLPATCRIAWLALDRLAWVGA
jgi:hypothetical protein